MKEHPILFKGDMIRAILEGRKTETRRVVKPQPQDMKEFFEIVTHDGLTYGFYTGTAMLGHRLHHHVKCPYGQIGDQLWVRETWAIDHAPLEHDWLVYRADGHELETTKKWKPSIHMFRKYSRITLEITEIKVERVQDMDRAAAFLEGCPQSVGGPDGDMLAAHIWFVNLWDSINKRRGFGWESNPWVWVVKFKELKP